MYGAEYKYTCAVCVRESEVCHSVKSQSGDIRAG